MVKYRNPVFVLALGLLTVIVYFFYWLLSTSRELDELTPEAPDFWYILLLLVPGLNIPVAFHYFWKYTWAIADISDVKAKKIFFLLLYPLWIIAPVAMMVSQIQLNKKSLRVVRQENAN